MNKSKNHTRYQIVYRLFYVLLLICVGLFGAGELLGINKLSPWHVLAAAAAGSLLAGVHYAKGRGKVLWLAALSGILLLGFLAADRDFLQEFWISYLKWAGNTSQGNIEYLVGYGCIQATLLAAGCYLFWCVAERVSLIKKLSAAGLLAVLVICLITKRAVSHMGVVFSLWYILMIYIEATQEKWEKVGEHGKQHYIIWLFPFCGLYFLVSCVMPAPEEPYDWALVKMAYHNVREAAITNFRNITRNGKEDFGLSFSGFSENGRLGAGFIENEQALLEIEGKRGLITNVYLIGKIYDTFDGKGWMQLAEGEVNDRFWDTMETLYAVERYDGETTGDYLFKTQLSLRYDYFDTGYLFTPLKTWQVDGCDYICDGTNLCFKEQLGYGTEYKTTYYQMNVDHPVFYEMLEAENEPDEEAWDALVRNHTAKGEYLVTLEDLENHRNWIYQQYGLKPVLSEKVEAYLEKVTAGAETDLEKLRAIETELSSYTYTKMPGKLPDSVKDANSYLEYFLLESRQGYCSYYATAFVLLARAEGIPARYVEGFCVPANEARKMTVYSNMAHAWPEVYLEGVGWIPFEPTPGYVEVRYTPWKVKGQTEEGISHAPLAAVEKEQWEEENTEENEAAEMTKEETADGNQRRNLIFPGICGILAVVLFIFLMDYLMGRYRYLHMEVRQQFFVEIRRNLWVLSRYGLVREDTETMQEFRERIQREGQMVPVCGYLFLTCYEEVLYGGREVTDGMLETVKKEQQILVQGMKEKHRIQYFLMCLRLVRYQ